MPTTVSSCLLQGREHRWVPDSPDSRANREKTFPNWIALEFLLRTSSDVTFCYQSLWKVTNNPKLRFYYSAGQTCATDSTTQSLPQALMGRRQSYAFNGRKTWQLVSTGGKQGFIRTEVQHRHTGLLGPTGVAAPCWIPRYSCLFWILILSPFLCGLVSLNTIDSCFK